MRVWDYHAGENHAKKESKKSVLERGEDSYGVILRRNDGPAKGNRIRMFSFGSVGNRIDGLGKSYLGRHDFIQLLVVCIGVV
jgi:hypothetical protein